MPSSGTVIHSAIEEKSETEMARPSPVRPRAISASSTAAWAYMPVPMSVAEMPTRPGACSVPVIEASPLSAWTSRS